MQDAYLPPGTSARHLIEQPQPAASVADVDKIIDRYLDDGDAKTHLIELILAMDASDGEQENMAICGLKQDLRCYVQKRGFYVARKTA